MKKITEIAEYAQSIPNIMVPIEDDFQKEDVDYSTKDILRIMNLLHKITIIQIKSLKNCSEQEELFREYRYLKYKVSDQFYM